MACRKHITGPQEPSDYVVPLTLELSTSTVSTLKIWGFGAKRYFLLQICQEPLYSYQKDPHEYIWWPKARGTTLYINNPISKICRKNIKINNLKPSTPGVQLCVLQVVFIKIKKILWVQVSSEPRILLSQSV